MKNRLLAGLLAVTVVLSAAVWDAPRILAAEKNLQNRCGFQTPVVMELTDASDVDFIDVDVDESKDTTSGVLENGMTWNSSLKQSKIYTSSNVWGDCDKYNSYFYYNKLNDSQKATWDALDSLCIGFLNGSVSIASQYMMVSSNPVEYATVYYMNQGVSYSGADAQEFYTLFRYANPQYYFLNSGVLTAGEYLVLVVYDDFVDINARNTATATIQSRLNSILSQIPAGAEEARAKWIYDYVCTNVSYNTDAINDLTWDAEERDKTQSLYSAVVYNSTVCAGYTLMYHALCNAIGIDAVSVTSDVHAWNMMRTGGAWVYVDTTWGDNNDITPSNSPLYAFFERNDNGRISWDTGDPDQPHVLEYFYSGLVESSIYDSGEGYTLTSYPTTVVSTPVITATSYEGDSVVLYISSGTAQSVIYYTMDGSTPLIGQARGGRIGNGGALALSEGQSLSLMAYAGNCLDSSVYTVSFDSLKKNLETPSIALSNETKGVKIAWNSVAGASGYRVQRLVSGSKYKTLATLGAGSTSYVDKSIKSKNGSTYTYRIEAVGSGALQNAVSKTKKIYRLTTPAFQSAKNVASKSIQLQWKRNKKATGYEIKYVLGSKTKTVKIKNNKTLKTTIKKLKKNKTYKVYIRSYKKNSSGTFYSAWSSVKKVKIKK